MKAVRGLAMSRQKSEIGDRNARHPRCDAASNKAVPCTLEIAADWKLLKLLLSGASAEILRRGQVGQREDKLRGRGQICYEWNSFNALPIPHSFC